MDAPTLTAEQAYEAAFRFVAQYFVREPDSQCLMLMLVSMEPAADDARSNDPASWADWLKCVSDTLTNEPLPNLRRS